MLKKPLSLYIHIPFCSRRCDYCHFYVVTGLEKLIPAYVEAVKIELKLISKEINSFEISTIYFGGGTPSLLSGRQIAEILATAFEHLNLAQNLEITLEANPENLTLTNLEKYFGAGINRLSLGLQAAQDSQLKLLGRTYTSADFKLAAKLVKKTGGKNLNLDLIFGLPNQTLADWEESLDLALAQKPQHLSCYSLELDHQSVFGQKYRRRQLFPPSDELNRRFYKIAKTKLAAAGFRHYEISNWALPGFECQHNLNFWQNQPYIGIGAGAHSFFQTKTWQNMPIVAKYIEASQAGHSLKMNLEEIKLADFEIEAIILNLRLVDGINLKIFEKNHQFDPLVKYSKIWLELISKKLIIQSFNNLCLTKLGQDYYDQIAILFWQHLKI